MSLHPPVLFIGDRPNPKKNLSMDVPFVGTKSYKTLLEWIYRMDIDVRNVDVVNAYDVEGNLDFGDPNFFMLFCRSRRVVVLGAEAREALAGSEIKYFKLPHPSGSNRDLNDKKKLAEQLARCRAFIYGG